MTFKELVFNLSKPLINKPLLAIVIVTGLVVLADGLQASANGLTFHWETGNIHFSAQGVSVQIGPPTVSSDHQ